MPGQALRVLLVQMVSDQFFPRIGSLLQRRGKGAFYEGLVVRNSHWIQAITTPVTQWFTVTNTSDFLLLYMSDKLPPSTFQYGSVLNEPLFGCQL